MDLWRKLLSIFWNNDEKRLRAFWRLGLHTVLFFLLNSVVAIVFFFLFAIVDVISGTRIEDVIASGTAGSLSNLPLIAALIVPASSLIGTVLATFLTGRWVDRRRFTDFGLHFSREWWQDLCFGLALGALLMVFVFLLGWLTDSIRVTGFFVSRAASRAFLPVFVYVLIKYLFVGIYEEMISRGYHLINLAEGFNLPIIGRKGALILAWVLSSVVFGVLHALNPNASLISTINIILAGLLFGLAMVLTGELAIPIGLHITWNFFQGAVFGFPVSGTGNAATAIATEMTGPAWFTGGAFGPEAGMLGLVAMFLGGVLIVLWIRRKGPLGVQWRLAEYHPDEGSSENDGMETGSEVDS